MYEKNLKYMHKDIYIKIMKFKHLSPMRIAKIGTAESCLMLERVREHVSSLPNWREHNLLRSSGVQFGNIY